MGDTSDGFDVATVRSERLTHPMNFFETLANLVKGALGSGILAMPYAFAHAGLLGGAVGTVCVTLVAGYGMYLIVRCAHELYDRKGLFRLSYAEVSQLSFENGPEKFRKFGKAASFTADFIICIDLLGSCVTYTISMAETIRQIVYQYYPDVEETYGVRWFIAFLLVPILLLCLIRYLKYFAYFSMFANSCLFVAVIVTIYYMLRPPVPSIFDQPQLVSIVKFPVFFSVCLFAMECVALLMTLENEMANPKRLISFPGVLCVGLSFCGILYGLVGYVGYLRYGEDTKGNIVLNIPSDEPLAQLVKALSTISLFITYALQFFAPMDIIFRHMGDISAPKIYLVRELVSFACVAVAWVCPALGGVISLIGAICLTILGIILPAICDLLLFYEDKSFAAFRMIRNILYIIIGIFVFFVGSYTSVIEIIHELAEV